MTPVNDSLYITALGPEDSPEYLAILIQNHFDACRKVNPDLVYTLLEAHYVVATGLHRDGYSVFLHIRVTPRDPPPPPDPALRAALCELLDALDDTVNQSEDRDRFAWEAAMNRAAEAERVARALVGKEPR